SHTARCGPGSRSAAIAVRTNFPATLKMRTVVGHVAGPDGRSNPIAVVALNGLGVGFRTANANVSPGVPVGLPALIVNTALLRSWAWFCVSCAVTRTLPSTVPAFG